MMKLLRDIQENDLLFHSWQYYSVVMIQFSLYLTVEYLNNPFYLILFVYGILPTLDILLPIDDKNPSEDQYKKLVKQTRFKIPVYLSVLADWILYFWAIHKYMTNTNGKVFSAGLIFAIISLEATNFNMAHELFHKTSLLSRVVGTSSLLKSMNTHFYIEHNQHHHVWVSTPKDTATSKFNQSSTEFIFQSMLGSFRHAWEIENQRCIDAYGTKFTYKNFMFYSTAGCLAFPLIGYFWFGIEATLIQLLIAFVSSSFLELINYIEHYGLQRKLDQATGKYEPVTIHHSWNAPYRVSNYLLFKLQRHSDHHENALKPYQVLASYEESPTLPQGYSVCLILSVIPSLWFKIMNPLVEIYNKRQKPTKELLDSLNSIIYKYIICVNLVLISFLVLSEAINRSVSFKVEL